MTREPVHGFRHDTKPISIMITKGRKGYPLTQTGSNKGIIIIWLPSWLTDLYAPRFNFNLQKVLRSFIFRITHW